MKYAKSLAYGGELIEALSCEYADFKRLVPLCPNCSNPVFLRAGGDRISAKGTPYKVGQHWSHFAGKTAEEVAACEMRVNGYSQAEREQIQKVARGQREKWIRRHLWKTFVGFWAEDPSETRRWIAKHQGGRLWQRMTIIAKSRESFSAIMEGQRGEASCDLYWKAFSELEMFSAVNKELHMGIFRQCLYFLSSRSGYPALLNILLFSCLVSPVDGEASIEYLVEKAMGKTGLDYLNCLAIVVTGKARDLLFTTPWAREFARLESEEAAQRHKRSA